MKRGTILVGAMALGCSFGKQPQTADEAPEIQTIRQQRLQQEAEAEKARAAKAAERERQREAEKAEKDEERRKRDEALAAQLAQKRAAFDQSNEELEVSNAFAEATQSARQEVLEQAARKRGFAGIKMGLGPYLGEIRQNATSTAEVRKQLVVVLTLDAEFTIGQVLGRRALMHDAQGDTHVFLEGYSGALYEGTDLASLKIVGLQIRGTEQYRSALGPRQAFVIRPVSGFDIDTDAIRERAVEHLFRDYEGPFGIAQFSNDQLVECITPLNPEVDRQKMASDMAKKGATPFRGTCTDAFSRPPEHTCTSPKVDIRTYPAPAEFEGFSEADCTGFKGTWH